MRGRLAIAVAVAMLGALASLPAQSPAESVQGKGVRVSVGGELSPQRLPRSGTAPVRISISSHVSAARGRSLPQLTSVAVAINRYGHIDSTGLPACAVADIQPATTAKALAACRGSLVGRGSFEAVVALDRQAAFPAQGELLAFSGTYNGRPAILAHVYGTEPVPTSFTLPFTIARAGGRFGTILRAKMPVAEGSYVTGFDLSLHRTYSYRGHRHSYASAGCPAPKGFPGAIFPLAQVSFDFVGGDTLATTLTRSCRARG